MSTQAMQDEDLIILSNDNTSNNLIDFSFDDTTNISGDIISFDENPSVSKTNSSIDLLNDIKADTIGDLFGENNSSTKEEIVDLFGINDTNDTLGDLFENNETKKIETPIIESNNVNTENFDLFGENNLSTKEENIDLFGETSSKKESPIDILSGETNKTDILPETNPEVVPVVSNIVETPKQEIKETIQKPEVNISKKVGFDRNAILDETISKLVDRISEIDSILDSKQKEVNDIESQIEELNKLKKQKNSEIKELNTEKDSAKSDIEILTQMKEGTSKKTK